MLKRYFAPTPKKWRKVGDSLLLISTSLSTYSIATDNKTIAIIIMIAGVLGKLISNLATEEPAQPNLNQ